MSKSQKPRGTTPPKDWPLNSESYENAAKITAELDGEVTTMMTDLDAGSPPASEHRRAAGLPARAAPLLPGALAPSLAAAMIAASLRAAGVDPDES